MVYWASHEGRHDHRAQLQHDPTAGTPRRSSLVFFPHPPYDALSACIPSAPTTSPPAQDLGMPAGAQGCRQGVQT